MINQTSFGHLTPENFRSILEYVGSLREVIQLSMASKELRTKIFSDQIFWRGLYVKNYLEPNEQIFPFSPHYNYLQEIKGKFKDRKFKIANERQLFRNVIEYKRDEVQYFFILNTTKALLIYQNAIGTYLSLIKLSAGASTLKTINEISIQKRITDAALLSPSHLLLRAGSDLLIYNFEELSLLTERKLDNLGTLGVHESTIFYSIDDRLYRWKLDDASEVCTTSPRIGRITGIFIEQSCSCVYTMDSLGIGCWRVDTQDVFFLSHVKIVDRWNCVSGQPFFTNNNAFLTFKMNATRVLKYHNILQDTNNFFYDSDSIVHRKGITAFCIHDNYLFTASVDMIGVWRIKECTNVAYIYIEPPLDEEVKSLVFTGSNFFLTTAHKVTELSLTTTLLTLKPEKKLATAVKKFLKLIN